MAWTKKSILLVFSGLTLAVVGLIAQNFQLIVVGILFVAFISLNSFIPGAADVTVQRALSAEAMYKGEDLTIELEITNGGRTTGILEIYDNIPHEMKLKYGLNYIVVSLAHGQTTRIRYTVKCPLRGHYSIGPVSLRSRNVVNLFYQELFINHRSDVIVYPKIEDVEEAIIRSRVPKMYTGATSLRQPGPGSEFFSLREYLPGDPFKDINWKAFAKRRKLMVNEKCREAVADVLLILDSRDLARIGTVLKNPLEYGAVAAASLASYFLKRRDSVGLAIYDDSLSFLEQDVGDKQFFKILSTLSGVAPHGNMPLQAVTNILLQRLPRGAPIFIISSLEGDGTVPLAIRDIAGRGHDCTVLSPCSVDFERVISQIPRMSYEVMQIERSNRLQELAGYGARVIDWKPDIQLSQALLEVDI